MAGKPANKKFVAKKDEKAENEQAIQAAINSSYSLLVPMKNCEAIYIKNPVTGSLKHFDVATSKAVNNSGVVDYLKELTSLGLGQKLVKDFTFISREIDPRWNLLIEVLKEKGCFERESV